MDKSQNIKLTSSELAVIWGAYMNASLTSTVLKYFIQKVEDKEIEAVIQHALDMHQTQLEELTIFFNKEDKQTPIGFTDQDVNVDAPNLYTDNFYLQYVYQMGALGLFKFSGSVRMSTREDVYSFFSEGLSKYNALHQKALAVSIEKGLYIRPPSIPTLSEVDFVKKQRFLTGWFGDRRPLTALEIANLFSHIQRNNLGIATLTGFSQVTESKEVKEYILRGIEIARKQVNVFTSILQKGQVPTPMRSDAMVTDSNEISPFSDKLMQFHVTGMITLGISFYGISISANVRRDLAVKYTRLSGEIGLYSEDGAEIMISNGWLEEPPRMVDREELAKTKHEGSK